MNKQCALCSGPVGPDSKCLNCRTVDIEASAPITTAESNSSAVASLGIYFLYVVLVTAAVAKFGTYGLVAMGICVGILVLISKTSRSMGLIAAIVLVPVTVLIAAALTEIKANRSAIVAAPLPTTTVSTPITDPFDPTPVQPDMPTPVAIQPQPAPVATPSEPPRKAMSAEEADAAFGEKPQREISRIFVESADQSQKRYAEGDWNSEWKYAEPEDPSKSIQK